MHSCFRILIPEAFSDDDYVMKYYGTPDYKISNFPFNFHFVPINKHLTAKDFDFLIQSWLKKMPAHGVANWVVSISRNFLFSKGNVTIKVKNYFFANLTHCLVV